MHNTLDFSKLERLQPREDSWEKVCARLDAEAVQSRSRILRFRIYAAIPLVASFALVAITLLLSAFSEIETSPISMQELGESEIASWYNDLGATEDDDFETLDESSTLSYLLKEDH